MESFLEVVELYELNMEQRLMVTFQLFSGETGVFELYWDDVHGVILDDAGVYYKITNSEDMTVDQAFRLVGADGVFSVIHPFQMDWGHIKDVMVSQLNACQVFMWGTIEREGRVQMSIDDVIDAVNHEIDLIAGQIHNLDIQG
jgi:hypothetical protein